MDINTSTQNGVALVTLLGRFDELATAPAESQLIQILNAIPATIILDLSGVEYISSSGLRILLMLARAAKQRNIELRLCGLTPFVAEVINISNLTTMFAIYPDSRAALAGLPA
jgi:anti-anti-sigma factor